MRGGRALFRCYAAPYYGLLGGLRVPRDGLRVARVRIPESRAVHRGGGLRQERGRIQADTWLSDNFDKLGKHSSVDLSAVFG